MNEITRIHIAKVAYDIEINAKKQLEKYLKSLESYTQDAEVLEDIEIRVTELLAERKVAAQGIITSEDVAAIRKQLGEPYEFANEDGDIAVGAVKESDTNHRLYRSLDDAVVGGVLSGFAAYFNVNPLWTRLVFILLAFISFGLALPVYLVLWLVVSPARTVAEKLQLKGTPVTLESIREMNSMAETDKTHAIAPMVRRVIAVGVAIVSIVGAVSTLVATIWASVAVFLHNGIAQMANDAFGNSNEDVWLAWLVYWVIVAGALLLATLFLLVAYALLAKKLTKKMIISGIVIIVLGITAVSTVIGITVVQSSRASSEAQAAVKTKKLNLPNEFSNVKTIVMENPSKEPEATHYSAVSNVQYIVDAGTPRYELAALPKATVSVKMENEVARITIDIPEDYRNTFVQPSLIIYGPAIQTIETYGVQLSYSNVDTQDTLAVKLAKYFGSVNINGTYTALSVEGEGNVDLSSSAIQSLTIRSGKELNLQAGTVRDLVITQPEVCASSTYRGSAVTSVAGVTSGTMTYNGTAMTAKTIETNCASVVINKDSDEDDPTYN
jgi:phage shock protein PspC (stress-responsive transcriptional regulator)